MNEQIYGTTVKRKKKAVPFERDIENEVKLENKKPVQSFLSLAEKVAKSTIYCRNWYSPSLQKTHPLDDRVKRFDKYFPYADGGALLVDEPMTPVDLAKCYAKRELLPKGTRYIVIEEDATLYELLEQLGEI